MEYVGPWRRMWAFAIDLVVGLLVWTIPLGSVQTGPGYVRWTITAPAAVAAAVLWLAYFAVLEGFAGATIGKAVLHLRVVDASGRPPGLPRALVRNLARVVDAIPYLPPYAVGGLTARADDRRQRLGDRWAATFVVDRASAAPAPTGAVARWALEGSSPPLPPPPA